MAEERIEIEIVLDDGSVQKGFQKVKNEGGKTGKSLVKNFTKVGAVAAVAAAALGAVFVAKGVRLAKEQENAVNELNTSLRLTGKFSEQASTDLQGFASSLQAASTLGDEAVLSTAALIQSLGNLPTDKLKEATQASADLSAALGIDLKAAALLVGKAAAGEISSFSRYGLVLKKGSNNAETFSKALTALNEKFGGAAASKVNTFEGATTQLSNSFGDFQEKIGDIIVKSPTLIAGVKLLTGFFEKLGASVSKAFKNEDLFFSFIKSAANAGKTFAAVFATPIELAFNVVKLGFKSIVNGINLALKNVVGAAAFVAKKFAPNSELAQNLQILAGSTRGVFRESSAEVREALANIGKTQFSDGLTTQIDTILNKFTELRAEVIASGAEIVDSNQKKLEQSIVSTETLFDQFKIGLFGVGQSVALTSEQIAKKNEMLKESFRKVGTEARDGFGKAVASGFTNVGKALANGENALQAFAQAFIGAIGQQAIASGTRFILEGLAYLTVPGFQGIGSQMIAAGAALATFGGALSAVSGGGGESGGGISSEGGADTGPISDIDAGEADDEEIERSSAVTVNVEGTILDPVSTGTQIAELLSEITDSNDIAVNV